MSERATANLNPLQRVRRRSRIALGASVPVIGASAWWSLQALSPTTSIYPPTLDIMGREPPEESEGHAPIEPSVFAVVLWNPAPPPPPPPTPPTPSEATAHATPPAPPLPLNIQLIGIITDTIDGVAVQKAAIYDADTDRLLIIADGERLREHVVRVLPSGVVELVDGQTTRQYRLRTDSGSPNRGPT